ncbi:tyrosine-type recombinase/integrase [Methanomassiliicoccaceae archaeon DOK]|nr:tyrosine-type recombinase/integrase [Methanomassiliicoccaceae archaeon DOK]
MTDFKQLDDYLNYLRAHGRRESTLRNYSINLNMILRTLKEGGHPHTAEEITADDVTWLNLVLSERVTENTRSQYLSMLTVFVIHYTGRDVKKQADILFNDERVPSKTPFITPEQFAQLYAKGSETDRMILVLGAYMGLRRMEIARLKEEDIHGEMMTIYGKGHGPNGKVVTMVIPQRVRKEIETYRRWKEAHPFGHEGEYLIESGRRHQMLRGISPDAVDRRMYRLAEDLGIEFAPHSLRRLFATTLYYEAGVDLITLKNLMRHSKSSSTVERYIAPYKKFEREASEELSRILGGALGEL